MRKLLGVLVAALTLVGMAGPASAASGAQRFLLTTVGGENAPGKVIASGVINAVGRNVDTSSVDNPDGSSSGTGEFIFPRGTVDAAHQEKGTFSFNPRTCTGKFSFTGTFEITGGTGAYAGATGSGTHTGSGTFVASRNPDGSCSQTATLFNLFVDRATGTIDVPAGGAAA